MLALSDSDFQKRVENWLIDRPHLGQRIARGARALKHTRLPKGFRFWGVTHWTSKTAVASSAPAVAHLFYGSISALTALAATAAIAGGHSLVSLFDQMSKQKKSDPTGSEAELVVRFGEIIAAIESRSTAPMDADDSIRSALGVIEILARRLTKGAKGDLSVSLATYNGGHADELKIRHRNPGNDRPSGKKFSGKYVLGHHACKAGTDPRIIHDLKAFGRLAYASPTQSKVVYRSILLIPVVRRVNEMPSVCGFISIDSKHAYAFYGNRANEIIVTCEPFIDHIQDLL